MSINLYIDCTFKCLKGSFRKKRPKSLIMNLTVVSVYFPVYQNQHEEIVEFVEEKTDKLLNNNHVFIG